MPTSALGNSRCLQNVYRNRASQFSSQYLNGVGFFSISCRVSCCLFITELFFFKIIFLFKKMPWGGVDVFQLRRVLYIRVRKIEGKGIVRRGRSIQGRQLHTGLKHERNRYDKLVSTQVKTSEN